MLKSLSPSNKLQKPPVTGIAFATPMMAFAASADDNIAPVSILDTASAYDFMPSPNGINFLPKSPRSLSPSNKLQKPPVTGIAFATDIIAFAAAVDPIIAVVLTSDAISP